MYVPWTRFINFNIHWFDQGSSKSMRNDVITIIDVRSIFIQYMIED